MRPMNKKIRLKNIKISPKCYNQVKRSTNDICRRE